MPKHGEVMWETFVSTQCGSARNCKRDRHTDWRRMVWDNRGKAWGNINAIWRMVPAELEQAILERNKESNE